MIGGTRKGKPDMSNLQELLYAKVTQRQGKVRGR